MIEIFCLFPYGYIDYFFHLSSLLEILLKSEIRLHEFVRTNPGCLSLTRVRLLNCAIRSDRGTYTFNLATLMTWTESITLI